MGEVIQLSAPTVVGKKRWEPRAPYVEVNGTVTGRFTGAGKYESNTPKGNLHVLDPDVIVNMDFAELEHRVAAELSSLCD